MKISKITTVFGALLAVGLFVSAAKADTWGGCDIKAIRMISEKILRFDVTTMQCTGAPCSATLYYVVESSPVNWPQHTTSELKAFQAMILTAMTTGKKVNVDFSWNGYTFPPATNGNYFLNWIEIPN